MVCKSTKRLLATNSVIHALYESKKLNNNKNTK